MYLSFMSYISRLNAYRPFEDAEGVYACRELVGLISRKSVRTSCHFDLH